MQTIYQNLIWPLLFAGMKPGLKELKCELMMTFHTDVPKTCGIVELDENDVLSLPS